MGWNAGRRRRACVVVIATVVMVVAASCAARDQWVAQVVPDPGLPGPAEPATLRDASCPTSDRCIAVGDAATFVGDALLGSTTATAAPPLAVRDLACVSDRWCMAVGGPDGRTVTARWDGAGWQTVPVPPLGADVRVVDCAAADHCLALTEVRPDGTRALVLRWDGTTWSDATPVDPAIVVGDVACEPGGACRAFGGRGGALVGGDVDLRLYEGATPAALRWTDGAWRDETSPTVDEAIHEADCPAVNGCVAITLSGSPGGSAWLPTMPRRVVASTLQASSWTTTTVWENLGAFIPLGSDLACGSVARCVLDGAGGQPGQAATAIAVNLIDGTWALGPPGMAALACASADACVAVDGARTVAWSRALGWHQIPTPAPPPAPPVGGFAAVACPTPSFCLAVGTARTLDRQVPIYGRFDGVRWTTGEVPHPTEPSARLRTVACSSPTFCVAGGTGADGGLTGVFFTWDGTAWTERPITPVLHRTRFATASCGAPSSCVLTGGAGSAMTWDGTNAVGDGSGPGRAYTSLTCGTPQRCVAGGGAVVVGFDGRTWSEVRQVGSWSVAGTSSASCVRDGRCFVLGVVTDGQARRPALFIQEPSGSWTVQPADVPAWSLATPDALSCTADERCVATRSGDPLTYVWNGTTWATGPAHTLGSTTALSCAAATCTRVATKLLTADPNVPAVPAAERIVFSTGP